MQPAAAANERFGRRSALFPDRGWLIVALLAVMTAMFEQVDRRIRGAENESSWTTGAREAANDRMVAGLVISFQGSCRSMYEVDSGARVFIRNTISATTKGSAKTRMGITIKCGLRCRRRAGRSGPLLDFPRTEARDGPGDERSIHQMLNDLEPIHGGSIRRRRTWRAISMTRPSPAKRMTAGACA